jgi:hypothetical protein
MKHISFTCLLIIVLIFNLKAQTDFKAGDLKIVIDNKGFFTDIINQKTKQNYLSKDTISPLVTLISQGKKFAPIISVYNKNNHIITLKYSSLLTIDVRISVKKTHLTFEIVKAEPKDKIEAIVWGPIPLNIKKSIGEIIGVVRNENVAIGLQVLNVKTDGGDYSAEGNPFARGMAAIEKKWGSNIQAYSINREIERYIDSWNGENKNTPVIPIKGETVVGSKIALFSCDEDKTLDWIEKIELAEELPHPTINGIWIKKIFQRGHSYLIADYTESNIDTLINFTKRAGLISLYHSGPFTNWGHYNLDTVSFPNGNTGIKKCVNKAKAAGLHLGVHTLTNFINTDDKYISPIPDKRLALTGFGLLDADIDENTKEIPVSTNEYFNNQNFNNLHAVKIGNEIIRYKNVSSDAPYKLIDCQRGSFNTKISSHYKYDTVGKLYDHAYKVFFPNLDLQREIAVNLAKFFNETGLDHMDFDGHEGCLASGQGNYAINLFADDFYKNLNHNVLNGTSNSKTYYWHINTYCNWGEPWYGGFKESMQEYRISNQGLFDRNLMPHMLGWYLLTKTTTIGEMEWMLARSAAYDAGFAMVTDIKSVEENPVGLELLDLIHEWENARLSSAFNSEQIQRLKDSKNEFHLEKINEKEWNLYQYHISELFIHKKLEKQPGEPTFSLWKYEITTKKQALQFKLFINGKSGNISKTKIIIDNYKDIEIPIELKAGQTIICDGSKFLRIYNEKGKQINIISLNNIIEIDKGIHEIIFDTKFAGDEDLQVEFSLKSLGNAERISKK